MNFTETILAGTIQADGTLVLDGKPSLPPGRVQVVVRPEADRNQEGEALTRDYLQTMKAIRASQLARGHRPRSMVEIEAEQAKFSAEMDQEIEEAVQLQEACRLRRKQMESESQS